MEPKIEKTVWIGTRPENVPAEWIVWNAPRPLDGDIRWSGDFRHGIWYAAVDPASERAAWQTRENIDSAASIVVFAAKEEIERWAMEEYAPIAAAKIGKRVSWVQEYLSKSFDLSLGYFIRSVNGRGEEIG